MSLLIIKSTRIYTVPLKTYHNNIYNLEKGAVIIRLALSQMKASHGAKYQVCMALDIVGTYPEYNVKAKVIPLMCSFYHLSYIN